MPIPALRVVSTRVELAALPGSSEASTATEALLQLADPAAPLALVRRDRALIGAGDAYRATFTGPDRIEQAAAFWRALSAAATIEDRVGVRGSGLVAFSMFTFDADGTGTNGFIVPSTLVGMRGDTAWITRVAVGDDDVAPLPTPTPIDPAPTTRFEPGAISQSEYERIVATAIGEIRAGDYDKIVLARDLVGRIAAGSDLRGIIASLAAQYPDVITYAADGLIGASPETLVRSEDGDVSARVLAGSAPRTLGADVDAVTTALLASDKDVQEHRFAADSAIEAFARYATVTAGDSFVLELPHVFHLATDLHGTLHDQASVLELVSVLHPTSAVGGTPTPIAVPRIRTLEGVDRGNYAGPVGWIDSEGNGEWAIALRGAHVAADGVVHAFAGAGIVGGSDPHTEAVEAWAKFGPMRDAFGDDGEDESGPRA